MSTTALRDFLLWCTAINYGLLIFWALLTVLGHKWFFGLCTRLYHVPEEQARAWNFGGIVIYKMGIVLFNLVPYIALVIVGTR